jgi:glycosyltransferase involved in cell wall biosynthesis
VHGLKKKAGLVNYCVGSDKKGNTMMRVLHLSKFDRPEIGGVEKMAHELCVGQSATPGVQADLMAMSQDMAPLDVPYRAMRSLIDVQAGAAPLSWGYVRDYIKHRNAYDVVHLHHPQPLATALVCLLPPRGKLVVHWQSDIVRQKYSYMVFKPFESAMLRRAARVIVATPTYVDGSAQLQTVRDKLVTIPNGIEDCVHEHIDQPFLAQLREQYKGKKIVFGLGRLIYYKGFEFLVDAARELPDDVVVLIAGGGPLREELQQRINAHGLSERVKLLGFVPREHCLAYMAACDVFCMSSTYRSEAFGVVQVEAMCFGKPVVSTRIPGSGVDWVNMHGESGLTVPPMDASALAQAIGSLCADPALYAQLSAGARARYDAVFTREKMVDATLALYRRCLGR